MLPGINVESGLIRVAGNQQLYRRLLLEFVEDHARDAIGLKQYLQAEDPVQAHRMVHTLKGVAGNLGADILSEAAQELEEEIAKKATEHYDALLSKLEDELNQVVESINSLKVLQPAHMSSESQCTLTDVSRIEPILTQMMLLVEEGDAEAVEYATTLRKYTQGADIEVQITRLEEQLDNYDFENAQQTLAEIRLALEIV
jgi:HPt (histidine-containing phosphotransfer) domain-containing protein